jgi:exonuclease SbcC
VIPIALRLDNFMSYRSPTTVDFSGVRTACLSGDNGAGKSALLEAMTWAVWGKTRASSDRDVIFV